jgi:ribonuclease T2
LPDGAVRLARRLLALVAAAVALAVASAIPAAAQDRPGDFDFYVLSLSWSPAYCALEGDAEGSEQCSDDAGHGFVVHGLWPQYEEGYPEFCGDADESDLPAALTRSMLDVMPDGGLIAYQWVKHGSCTGLSPEDYFAETRAAFERIGIPETNEFGSRDGSVSAEAIEEAFITENPGLGEDGIAVSCKQGLLAEVRICLTRKLEFRACEEVDARGCRDEELFITP